MKKLMQVFLPHAFHTETIRRVLFSPCGKYLVTGSNDGDIVVWDYKTGTSLKKLKGEDYHINALLFNKSGNFLISGDDWGYIKIWDFHKGELVAVMSYPAEPEIDEYERRVGYMDGILSMALSPDEETLVVEHGDFTIKIWDTLSRQCKHVIRRRHVYHNASSIAISPCGTFFISADRDYRIQFWDIESGDCFKTLINNEGDATSYTPSNAVAISADGHYLISANSDNDVVIWDLSDYQPIAHLKMSGDICIRIKIQLLDDDRYLAVLTDKGFSVWNFNTKEQVYRYGGSFRNLDFALTPDYKSVILCKEIYGLEVDQSLVVRDLKTDKIVRHFAEVNEYRPVFACDSIVAYDVDGNISTWNVKTGQKVNFSERPGIIGGELLLSPDEKYLVVGNCGDIEPYNKIKVFDFQTTELLYEAACSKLEPDCSAINTLNQYVYAEKNRIKVWDLSMATLLNSFEVGDANIYQLNMSKSAPYVMSRDDKGIVKLWHLPEARCVHRIENTGSCFPSAISNDASFLAWEYEKNSRVYDYKLVIYSLEMERIIHSIDVQDEEFFTLSFSADNRHLLTGNDRYLKVWCVETGQCVYVVDGDFLRFYFTSDAQYLVACGANGLATIWRYEDYKYIYSIDTLHGISIDTEGYFKGLNAQNSQYLRIGQDALLHRELNHEEAQRYTKQGDFL